MQDKFYHGGSDSTSDNFEYYKYYQKFLKFLGNKTILNSVNGDLHFG